MDGLPAHLLGAVDDKVQVQGDELILYNISVMKQRVNKSRLSESQKAVHLNLINQVIEKWNTPERYDYIQRAAAAEKLYESQGLMGLAGVDQVEGLAGFWDKIKNAAKKVGGAVVSVAKAALPIAAGFIPGAGGLISKFADGVLNPSSGGAESQPVQASAAMPSNAIPQLQQMAQGRVQASATPIYSGGSNTPVVVNNYITKPVEQPQAVRQAQPVEKPKKWYQKMSTPAKVGVGVGGTLVLGTVIYLATRKPKQQYSYQYAPVNPRYNPPHPKQLQGVGGAKKKTVKHSEKQKNATDAKVVKTIKKVELK